MTSSNHRFNITDLNVEIDSDNGHDAFLLKEPEFHKTLKGFLDSTAKIFSLIKD